MSTATPVNPVFNHEYGALAFWDQHGGTIVDNWPLLGLGDWNGLTAAVETTQPLIPKMHGLPVTKTDSENRKALKEFFEKIGLYDGLRLLLEHTNGFEIHGAKLLPMIERAGILLEMHSDGFRADRYVFITGQRPRSTFEDGNLADLWLLIESYGPNVSEHHLVLNEWKKETPFATQAELSILALIIACDGLAELVEDSFTPAQRMFEPRALKGQKALPERAFADVRVRLFDEYDVLVINCPGRPSKDGPIPPSSISAAQHRMRYYPPEDDAIIGILQGRVHWLRILGELENAMHAINPSVTIVGHAEGAHDEETRERLFNNVLGELFRLLYNVLQEAKRIL